MQNFMTIAQITLSVIIIAFVLLQAQGSGLGSNWAGGGETYHTRRGVEKIVFYMTIVAIALFLITSIILAIN